MSKSRHTVQRYAASWRGQTSLDNFNFGTTNLPKTVTPGGVAPFKNAANGATPMTAVPHVRQVSHSPSLDLDDDTTLVENEAGMDDEALANNAELERIEAECQELPLNEDDSET